MSKNINNECYVNAVMLYHHQDRGGHYTKSIIIVGHYWARMLCSAHIYVKHISFLTT